MRSALVALAAALALPFVLGSNYQLGIAQQALIFVIVASGYNILLGFTGLVSFGHIALFGIGAYTSAILVTTAGMPFLAGLAGAAAMAGVVGVLIAIPALRIKGHYLTLLTLALAEVIRLVIRSMSGLTHGSDGFSGIPRPVIFGHNFRAAFDLYYLLLALRGAGGAVRLAARGQPFRPRLQGAARCRNRRGGQRGRYQGDESPRLRHQRRVRWCGRRSVRS